MPSSFAFTSTARSGVRVMGVGRVIVKLAQEAARLAPAARAAYLPSRAREVIEFLNRVGVNNTEQWLPNEIRPA